MTSSLTSFEDFQVEKGGSVNGIGNNSISVEGKGKVNLGNTTIHDAQYVPDLPVNLL